MTSLHFAAQRRLTLSLLRQVFVAIILLTLTPSLWAASPDRARNPDSTASAASAAVAGPSPQTQKNQAVKLEPGAKQHWAKMDDQTPAISEADLRVLLRNPSHVFDAMIIEKTPAKSLIYIRMNTGYAWRSEINTLDIPSIMQTLVAEKIRFGLVQDAGFSTLKRGQSEGALLAFLSVLPYGQLVGQFIFIVLLILAMVWAQTKASKMISGKRIQAVKPSQMEITFEDVAGIDEAVRDMRESVAFLAHPEKFSALGAKPPKGILLIGPPGGGKTMLAKAFAKECNAPFYAVSGSEFVEVFAGVGAARIRSLFKKASRAGGKAVIFIDEIDALAKKRGRLGGHDESDQTLNELLVKMDGINPKKSQIMVIAATNRVDAMDEAILRPGRFDRKIYVTTPSMKGREDIFRVYLKKHLSDTNVDVVALSRVCIGFSAADIANLVNEALLRAAREGHTALTQEDLMAARDKILLGDPRKDLDMTEAEIHNTALHEAGHAVIAHFASKDPVEKVTIEPRARALGLMLQIPQRDAVSISESEIKAKLVVLMAGRAAEEVFNGDVSTGASSDMERAFSLAIQMVSQWGYGKTMGKSAVTDLNQLSPGLRQAVETEAKDIVDQQYRRALDLVMAHRSTVEAVAAALQEQETLDRKSFLSLVEAGEKSRLTL